MSGHQDIRARLAIPVPLVYDIEDPSGASDQYGRITSEKISVPPHKHPFRVSVRAKDFFRVDPS